MIWWGKPPPTKKEIAERNRKKRIIENKAIALGFEEELKRRRGNG